MDLRNDDSVAAPAHNDSAQRACHSVIRNPKADKGFRITEWAFWPAIRNVKKNKEL